MIFNHFMSEGVKTFAGLGFVMYFALKAYGVELSSDEVGFLIIGCAYVAGGVQWYFRRLERLRGSSGAPPLSEDCSHSPRRGSPSTRPPAGESPKGK